MPNQRQTQNNNNTNAVQGRTSNMPPTEKQRKDTSSIGFLVKLGNENGALSCNNIRHHTRTSIANLNADGTPRLNGQGNASYRWEAIPVIRQEAGWKRILEQMMPGQKASCPCEMKACEMAWLPHHQDHVRFGSRYVNKGDYVMGLEGVGSREMFVSHLLLTKEVKDQLAKAHPNYYFVGGSTHHSHPFCHISTQIATRRLWDRLISMANMAGADANKPYEIIDLHGNPRANVRALKENHSHRKLDCTTIVEYASASDAIRSRNKWAGAPYTEGSLRACGVSPDPSIPVGSCDALISVHSGYYYDFKEISATLWRMPEASSMWMIMHKFALPDGATRGSSSDCGTFGHGEVRWQRKLSSAKGVKGQPIYVIEQEDALTGTKYIHNDNTVWFETSTWAEGMPTPDNRTGITWSIDLCGPDTYLVQVVRCNANLVWTAEAFAEAARSEAVKVYKDKRSEFLETGCIGGRKVTKAPKSFLAARDALVGKTVRDDKEWTAHVARFRRLLDKNKESDDDLMTVCFTTFFMDVVEDRERLMVAFANQRASAAAYNKVQKKNSKADNVNWGNVLGTAIMVAATVVDALSSPAHKIAAIGLKQAARVVDDYA